MTWLAHEREAALAIGALTPAAEAIGSGWRFGLGGRARTLRIAAEVEGGWLLLDAPLEKGTLSHESLVEANARLRGGAKFALLPGDERVHVRAELPLGVGSDLAARLLEARCGCGQAAALVRGGRAPEDGPWRSRSESDGDASASPVAENALDGLCEEAGWVFTRRSPQCLAVDLEETGGFSQAQLERRTDGALALTVKVDDCHPAGPSCEKALAIFSLRCCGWLRMARAAAEPASEGERPAGKRLVPRFEVVLAVDASPSELSEALSSLSVAVRFGARELCALARSEELARRYLAFQPRGVLLAQPVARRIRGSGAGAGKARTKNQEAAPH
jgi:hypothetical protein